VDRSKAWPHFGVARCHRGKTFLSRTPTKISTTLKRPDAPESVAKRTHFGIGTGGGVLCSRFGKAVCCRGEDDCHVEPSPMVCFAVRHSSRRPESGAARFQLRPLARRNQKPHIVRALEKWKGNYSLAARDLYISRRVLAYRMEKYGIARRNG
jgi:transcriptional regulator with GAF, ATPase, and Fis domain